MLEEGFDFRAWDWREHPYFRENIATECYREIAGRFDAFLGARGYRHEGLRFVCEGGAGETIALFSHGGSGACALAHLMNLPFPYVASAMPCDFASIIALDFPVREGARVFPRLALFNDCAHVRPAAQRPTIQRSPDGIGAGQRRGTNDPAGGESRDLPEGT